VTEPIRIYCDDPEYGETWIDLSPRWTQGDMQKMLEVQGDEFYAFLRSKCIACHIQTADGAANTDPAQLTDAGMVDVDVLLIGWLGRSMPLAVAKRRALGNASARLSLPNSGTATNPTTTPTTAAPA
jgi:hypothetical protein